MVLRDVDLGDTVRWERHYWGDTLNPVSPLPRDQCVPLKLRMSTAEREKFTDTVPDSTVQPAWKKSPLVELWFNVNIKNVH